MKEKKMIIEVILMIVIVSNCITIYFNYKTYKAYNSIQIQLNGLCQDLKKYDKLWKVIWMLKIIDKIPVKLRVCLSVLIIGLITLLISPSAITSTSSIAITFAMIGSIVTIAGIVSLIIYWLGWVDKQ